MSYVYVWEFFVRENTQAKFIEAYGPKGIWEKLFRMDDRYLKTQFLRDINNKYRFITIDHWVSKEAKEEFRKKYAEEFKKIDDYCESLTDRENFLGEFDL